MLNKVFNKRNKTALKLTNFTHLLHFSNHVEGWASDETIGIGDAVARAENEHGKLLKAIFVARNL